MESRGELGLLCFVRCCGITLHLLVLITSHGDIFKLQNHWITDVLWLMLIKAISESRTQHKADGHRLNRRDWTMFNSPDECLNGKPDDLQ